MRTALWSVQPTCVPTSMILCSLRMLPVDAQIANASRGWASCRYSPIDSKLDWSKFMENKHKELHRLNNAYRNTLGKAGVEIVGTCLTARGCRGA